METASKPLIIIIEDSDIMIAQLEHVFHKNYNLAFAKTVEQAKRLLDKEAINASYILFDGCLERPKDTIPLLKEVKQNPDCSSVVTIAISSIYNRDLVEAGCDYECLKKAEDIAEMVERIEIQKKAA